MTDETACFLDLSFFKAPHHGSSVPWRYTTPEVLHQDITELGQLRSDLAHETAHIQLSYYQVKEPSVIHVGEYRLQPAGIFTPFSQVLYDVRGAAATICTEAWSWATPAGAASTMLLGAADAPNIALSLAGPTPSYSLAELPSQASLPEDSSPGGAIEPTLTSPATQRALRPRWPGQFGSVAPVAVKAAHSDEDGLLYHVSNEPVFGAVLILRTGVFSTYRDGLLSMVDGIRAVLRLLLVLVLAALAGRPDIVAFLLVILAVCLCFGYRGEPDDHVLSTHETSPIAGEAIGIA
jgi:hypothetical protein